MRNGDTGAAVRDLQKLLGIEADGWYGEKTEAAVREFQRKVGLVADGVAGSQTLLFLKHGVVIGGRSLTHAAVLEAAAALDVDLGTILSVTDVEAGGDGFLPDGRPDILFERHIMHKRLKAADRDADALAAKYPNIVNTLRGGYAGGSAEHFRLNTAIGIDKQCALESASWGMFQIMGYHWQALGYDSVDDFVSRMQKNEGEQLDAFVRFVKADPALHKALKARKWAEFAKIYNGPAYRENLYDAKLARAYERHSGVEA